MSPHHGSLRIEPNASRHHHFICLQCHAITDLVPSEIDESPLKNSVPQGFRIAQVSMEVRGLCKECAEKSSATQA